MACLCLFHCGRASNRGRTFRAIAVVPATVKTRPHSDEPEIHLHPSWIRQLYLVLPRLGENNQYLLTTHSAELRQRAVADHALVDLGELDQKQ